ncbi:3301_t:CDS:2 [Entrophospora sp. SA101]|nr:3295_t:CDS:2 [Entrophospora sp. SA101]CAJ0630861.1 3301_t:CDS:2 [Entrophospora sp. SA101]CAJ0846686.1 1685_t:CDS:2 [Entrophospora sp. SA101]
MHQTNGGLHVVDIIKEFSVPSTKDQLYILREVIENVYLFKKIIPFTKTHVCINESPIDASPSKVSRSYDALKYSK